MQQRNYQKNLNLFVCPSYLPQFMRPLFMIDIFLASWWLDGNCGKCYRNHFALNYDHSIAGLPIPQFLDDLGEVAIKRNLPEK